MSLPTHAPLGEPCVYDGDKVAEYRREIHRGKLGSGTHFAIMRTTESKLDSVLIWDAEKTQWKPAKTMQQIADCYHKWARELYELIDGAK